MTIESGSLRHRQNIIGVTIRALAVRVLCIFALLMMPTQATAQLVNTGQVSGIPASGSLPLPLSQSTVTIPVVTAVETIELIKSVTLGDTNGDGHAQIGETLIYGFSVRNTGNVTLTNISVSDPTATITGGPIPSLAPGITDAATFTATHTLDAGDLAAGSRSNQATVVATSAKAGSTVDAVTDLSDSSNPADGPGLNDPTVVTFTAAPLVATDDSATGVDGAAGGPVAGLNVLSNDTLDGVAVVAADVTIAPVTTGPLTVNADGTVTVAPGTAAGTYVVAYEVCEVLNPANCDSADVSVTVGASVIVAGDDTVTGINGLAGNPSVVNAYGNDTMNGGPLNLAALTPAIVTPSANPNVALDLLTGTVSVAADTPAGTYSITYRLCETLNPANCDDAIVSVTVDAAPLVATDDSATGVDGAAGGPVAGLNVLSNDTLDGVAVVAADVTIAPVTTGPLTVNADGTVTVAPGTAAGTYVVAYEVCEVLNPANCDSADVSVTVGASVIVAGDDTVTGINGLAGNPSVVNAYGNDTMNGGPLNLAALTPAIVTPSANPNVALDLLTGTVSVAADTPAGTYSITYRLCETLNPANCDDAIVSVTVDAAPLVATDDSATGVDGAAGGPVAGLNVLSNDTLDGVAVVAADVTIAPVTTGPLTVSADGTVTVAPGTAAGTYVVAYEVCEVLNPANCDSADVSVTVGASVIVAGDDTVTGINGLAGNPSVVNAYGNDTMNGGPLNLAALTPAIVTPSANPNVALDLLTGTVSVAADTPAGTYSITYRLCETLNPANCDDAIVSVTVDAAPLVATDDSATGVDGAAGGPVAGLNVLSNDTLDGVAVVAADVTIAPVTTGPLTVNADGTVTVAPGTAAGTYVVAYEVCEVLNPANCDSADVSVTVGASVIVAGDDTVTGINGLAGNPSVVNAYGNDTMNGGPLNLAALTPAIVTPSANPNVALDLLTGTVSVAADTPAGTYSITYRLCETLNPANCDDAIVSVTVDAAPLVATDDSATGVDGAAGGPVAGLNVLSNDTLDGVAVVAADVTIAPVTTGPLTVNADGTVTVAPGTAAGTYVVAYEVCEVLNPANCDSADVSVTVGASVIVAGDDTVTGINGLAGNPSVVNAYGNDTMNGGPLNLAALTPAIVTPSANPNVALDLLTGTVSVAADTPAGTYSITYRLCETLNPANCDDAIVSVTVDAAPLVATDDSATGVDGAAGGPVAGLNVLSNDTLDGVAVVAADVTIAPVTTGPLTVNADGTVTVAPGTAAGTYVVAYEVCEVLNPANCDSADVSVTVEPMPIIAVADTVINVDGFVGGVIPGLNVLTNDTLDGVAIVATDVTIVPVTTGPLTVNADGSVTVVPGTPGGTYLVTYEVCENLNPANCSTADVSVDVLTPVNRVSGVIFEDENSNGLLDFTDTRVGGYTVQLVNGGTVIATTIANTDGSYEFVGIAAGAGYSIAAVNPDTGNVVTGRGFFTVNNGSVIVDINLPIDPSGVVYDSATRLPVSGAVLTMTNNAGVALPVSCFASPGQQPQTTGADGAYRFDIMAGANASCPSTETEYRISISAPSTHVAAPSAIIAPSLGTLDATTCPVDVVFGGSCAVQPQNTAPVGAAATTYFLAFLLQAGDPNVVHNHIPLDAVLDVPGDVSVTKVARSQTGVRGGAMTYTITATNNGGTVTSNLNLIDKMPIGFTLIGDTVDVNGSPVTPVVDGRTVTMPAVTIPGSGRVTVVLQLRIPSNAAPGTYENIAYAADPVTGEQIGTSGKAIIRIKPEAVFDCGDVIGKVFDDKNANGYQDKGELGIPGVRLATVRGELITTDKNGQYHVPCAMLPDQKIGSNFILKLDPRTLPTGFRVSTENPRVIRLTAGKVSKLNFGATIGRVVRLDLRGDAFENDKTSLKPEWASGLTDLVNVLKDKNSVLRLTYFSNGESGELVRTRVREVRRQIESYWKKAGGPYKLPIEIELVKN